MGKADKYNPWGVFSRITSDNVIRHVNDGDDKKVRLLVQYRTGNFPVAVRRENSERKHHGLDTE